MFNRARTDWNCAGSSDHSKVVSAIELRQADAIESVGISATLAERLALLEKEKAKLEQYLALDKAAPNTAVRFLPNVPPALIQRWREPEFEIEDISANPATKLADVEVARSHPPALLGAMTLEPRDGVLWAHPSPNAKGFTEVKPLEGLRINSHFSGSGGRMALAANAAQLVSAPLFRCFASGRLGLNLLPRRFKTRSTQNKNAGPDKTGPGIFIW